MEEIFTARCPRAVGTRCAFCLGSYEYPGLSYYPFDTYAQCQASASGRNLQCVANPYFNGPTPIQIAVHPFPPNPYYRY